MADPFDYAVSECVRADGICIHRVTTRTTQHYRSIQAFKRHQSKFFHNVAYQSRAIYFQVYDYDYFVHRRATEAFVMGWDEFSEVPTRYHDNLMALYEAIGWDRFKARLVPK